MEHVFFLNVLKKEEEVCGVGSRQADRYKQI